MKINEVEALVGITRKNIRFYEAEGLLSPRLLAEGLRNGLSSDSQRFFNPDRSWPSYLVPSTPNGENHSKRANIKVTKQRKFLTRPLCAVKLRGVC